MIRFVVQGVGRFGLVATMLYAGLAGEGLVSPRVAAAHAAPEGFGASTLGGSGKATYRVTSLADSGAGTLRDALAQGNRTIVFDVAGTISVRSSLFVRGGYVTIDGSTAPAPGITLAHTGLDAPILAIRGDNGAHDV